MWFDLNWPLLTFYDSYWNTNRPKKASYRDALTASKNREENYDDSCPSYTSSNIVYEMRTTRASFSPTYQLQREYIYVHLVSRSPELPRYDLNLRRSSCSGSVMTFLQSFLTTSLPPVSRLFTSSSSKSSFSSRSETSLKKKTETKKIQTFCFPNSSVSASSDDRTF